ncbi:DEAD/DEAH box helicase [Abditibacterium utsteinense]|uniref:DEAD/DEAH box helicase n=1 Tax=Abditibacterium utsteinense TaxID=1960156 RepID=UPI000D095873|nr:helicase-related protein [Abditibacterium utsteinense]
MSGDPTHCRVADIRPIDNVLIATLQTMMHAVPKRTSRPGLDAWLGSAEKLVVVFDEAHHAPAPRYRALVKTLRETHPNMLLLGLTATPTYGRKNLRGWLGQLFPQGILSQTSAKRLMLDGVLARPIFEVHDTQIVPDWDETNFEKWRGTFRDLPEEIVSSLAYDERRNDLIAATYVSEREKYGQTIIFAERWFQCEQICQALQKRGVRAGTVYSYVGGGPETADLKPQELTRRRREANAQNLEEFRRGDLDLLVNVLMLTEGTDVPSVQSVFLCNQTLSTILLAQKVGRALRGPKFGGTENAYIVAFHDNWKQPIPWADYELEGSDPLDNANRPTRRPPLQQISIEMMRQLARSTDQGLGAARGDFLSLVPVGWYAVTFEAAAARSTSFGADLPDESNNDEAEETLETVRDLVLVYDRDHEAYTEFVAHLQTRDLQVFEGEDIPFQEVLPQLQAWHSEFFSNDSASKARAQVEESLYNLLRLARHIAQRQGSGEASAPPFLPFEQRGVHDLDALARGSIAADLGPASKMAALRHEFERTDCLWNMIYPTLSAFKSQYDACENRILMGALGTIGSIAALEAVPADALETGAAPEATAPETTDCETTDCETFDEPEFGETATEPKFGATTAGRELVEQ